MTLAAKNFTNLLLQVILGLALVFGLPTYLAVTRIHYGQLVDSKAQDLKSLATGVSWVLSKNLKERSREIELLAQTPLCARTPAGSAGAKAALARVQQSYPLYSWIGVADLGGTVRAATQGILVHHDVAKRPWFQAASKSLYVGDLHEAKLLGEILKSKIHEWPIRFLDFAAPVLDESGAVCGVLGSHVHWAWAKELVDSVTPIGAKDAQIDIFLVNRNNEVIFPEAATVTTVNLGALNTNTQQFAEFMSWGSEELYLTAISAIQSPVKGEDLDWRVVVRQPKSQVINQLVRLESTILFIIFGAGLAFGLLAWWVGKWVGRPIRQLTQVAQDIASGKAVDFNVKTQTKELRNLNQALRSMAQNLRTQQRALEDLNRDLESKVAERTAELTAANKAMESLTLQDPLTGLANRLAANQWLDDHFRLMKRHQVPYAVLGMDIDFFKKVNDTHGHAAGDAVLRHVAGILMAAVRETDLVARVGGEEFLVILPMTSMIDARIVAEKIRSCVESEPVEAVGQVTLSIGIALASLDDADADVAVKAADEMLYEAKRKGRNRVQSATS